ncbi:acyl-ACP--UDP-N-acetylglucosamine O-acyltransferase [Lentilitoribacter sp. Alg239-R112]|uniref:acyl-ACP--UDP-N-acetylglucosamine O-acyltransferase n=1 Tax=Lentilitoribacter sp. Alg239-R112 TaxID=2305987 RepID=UPI0013A6BCFF|nr:acyl-ACP--UDP-N-acetylglucosamine O-acyltransferase [Lentilitoribacter sp. Alg239-R112]
MISASAQVHPSSIVEDGAILADGVKVGPFCMIGSKAQIGKNVELKSHISVMGNTKIGADTLIFPQAALGGDPQNIHYNGEDTKLIIGERCTIREGVTMNTGMPDAGNRTIIGNDCLFLAYSHIAHDCRVGNNVILSNNVMLGGHVEVGNNVIMGGGAAAHQFVRIGHHAFMGGLSLANHDVIPFGMVTGAPGSLMGLNVIGLSRSGFSRSDILSIRRFYKHMFEGVGHFKDRLEQAKASKMNSLEKDIFDFVSIDSKRGFLFPPQDRKRG